MTRLLVRLRRRTRNPTDERLRLLAQDADAWRRIVARVAAERKERR